MNTVNINDENFTNSKTYQDFLKQNPSQGYLKIRAYAANQAIPISGLKVIVSKNIDNNNVVFFDGNTNNSGVIEKITLPTPKLNESNLTVPNGTEYDIIATYVPHNVKQLYKVNMYEGVCVIQNINIVPDLNIRSGGFYGS